MFSDCRLKYGLLRCVHTSVVGHRPTSVDIVARVETISTFVRRRRPMHITDASMNASLLVNHYGPWHDSSSHINNVCRSACLAISKIGQMRKYLDRNMTERLVHDVVVTSRLGANNSLLLALPNSAIFKLQRVQNSAVRLVIGALLIVFDGMSYQSRTALPSFKILLLTLYHSTVLLLHTSLIFYCLQAVPITSFLFTDIMDIRMSNCYITCVI